MEKAKELIKNAIRIGQQEVTFTEGKRMGGCRIPFTRGCPSQSFKAMIDGTNVVGTVIPVENNFVKSLQNSYKTGSFQAVPNYDDVINFLNTYNTKGLQEVLSGKEGLDKLVSNLFVSIITDEDDISVLKE